MLQNFVCVSLVTVPELGAVVLRQNFAPIFKSAAKILNEISEIMV